MNSQQVPPPRITFTTFGTLALVTCLLAFNPYSALFAVPPADSQPSPQLTPEAVIQQQMKALTAEGPIQARIERCYRFASPANRKHTGPLDRFARMVQTPNYVMLLAPKHFLVGRAHQNGREAHLLLSIVDADGKLCLFRCFLTKQTAAPYADCWMTDAVIRLGDSNPRQDPLQPVVPGTDTI